MLTKPGIPMTKLEKADGVLVSIGCYGANTVPWLLQAVQVVKYLKFRQKIPVFPRVKDSREQA